LTGDLSEISQIHLPKVGTWKCRNVVWQEYNLRLLALETAGSAKATSHLMMLSV
jgi:hypothetical protein